MRIAFICKRQYMGKDVIVDRYARLYEIPFQLARLGHEVRGFCLSYQGHDDGEWQHDAAPGRLSWESRSLGALRVPALAAYPWRLLRRLRAFAPQVLIGASDIPQVALTGWLSRRLGVPYATDLYDNFEGFGQARIPGMISALRHAVRNADLVTTTSEPLRRLVVDEYQASGDVVAMPSTVDKAVFHERPKQDCRRALGLPADARLVGTAGGLHGDKGVGTLYEAWRQVAALDPSAHLVLAGPTDPYCPPPIGKRVHYLGMLAHAKVAELFGALDVGVIYLRDTVFGRYCFPQKAYEMAACGLAIVAGNVGAMADVLHDYPQCLYRPDDAHDLAERIGAQLRQPTPALLQIDDWGTIIANLEPHLRKLATR
ncbi:MAG TPA: glycosyltransferase family 4 protein [Rudaea sp.]